MDYTPVPQLRHPRRLPPNTDKAFWLSFRSNAVFVKEWAPVVSVAFSQARPHRFAVASASRVQLYSDKTRRVDKVFSRFVQNVRSANFRPDGKLMVAGDDSGLVQVFDITGRTALRSFREHQQ